jgi:dTDP-glucose 4,6-dehydratase
MLVPSVLEVAPSAHRVYGYFSFRNVNDKVRFGIILVTGGLGFIGKHFVRRCLARGDYVVNVDVVNYAADRVAKTEFDSHDNYRFMRADISELASLPECDVVANFAAESHVDESIADSFKFCRSNILGTQRLLELIRKKAAAEQPLLVQISTDEVYGDIADGKHTEEDRLVPSNPYSSTKAAADMLIAGWARTFGHKYNIVRMSNNYGPHQYPEKLIPKSCARLMRGLPALVHGDGSYIRSWLHVEDAVEAILAVVDKGQRNAIYNICGDLELPNLDVIKKIAELLGRDDASAYQFSDNRVGQDIRYSMDDSKIRALGWQPRRDFDEELSNIVRDFDFQRFL